MATRCIAAMSPPSLGQLFFMKGPEDHGKAALLFGQLDLSRSYKLETPLEINNGHLLGVQLGFLVHIAIGY